MSENEPVIVSDESVAGADIEEVIHTRLGPALDGLPVPLAVLSMIASCCLLLKPEIGPGELEEAITSIGRTMMLQLSDLPGEAN